MPTYLVLTKLTDKGITTLKDNPKRVEEVNKEIEGMGGKVKSQYVVFGQYDFANIIEVPDPETMAKISVNIGARGTVRNESLEVMKVDDLFSALE